MEDFKTAVLEGNEDNFSIQNYDIQSTSTFRISNELKICTFFSKFKNCRYGENCKFKHCMQNSEQKFPTPNHNRNIGFHDRIFVSKSSSNRRTPVPHFSDKKIITKKVICRYFKAGNCDKGDHCIYQHSLQNDQTQLEVANIPINAIVKKRRMPICHYFKKGACHRGENCKFYHSPKQEQNLVKNNDQKCEKIYDTSSYIDTENVKDVDVSANDKITSSIASVSSKDKNVIVQNQDVVSKPYFNHRKMYDASNLTDEQLIKLRDTEILQLKKRYPKHIISAEQSILFTFEPSDPDWPFDLKSLDLEAYFPDQYPIEVCKITVTKSSNNIPDMLIRHLNQSIKEWIEKRFEEIKCSLHTELMFRPFLKWFDRNLEELFICGLRKVKRDIEAQKDGIEFVPVDKLFSASKDSCNTESIPREISVENISNSIKTQEEDNIDSQFKKLTTSSTLFDNKALKQGIKVIFNGLELVEGIATFSCSKLSMTVQCIRCKTSCNIKCCNGKISSTKCSKCSKAIECSFSPSMMHQFSNVAGNLHVIECQIVDINLVESVFVLDCLHCCKLITIDGLHYGQKQKRWCTSCNEKLIFSIENVKFQATTSTFIAAKNDPVKKTEKRKDPLFREGEPLPAYGTCKHYKKSYRWLRFPCCGRLYPCDICHDEKENDHEMKFASRMICGFCSKEQPYSKDKPCTSCSGSMTAKSGAHWEGGKGCRNKIKMARDDKHKYSGTAKTVSKKSQGSKSGKK